MYPTFHLCTDTKRSFAFAALPKTEENIVIIVILYKRKADRVMLITDRGK
jgi:hypothetical protein